MATTNFPGGVSSQGVPVLGSGPVFTTGTVFFVDSNGGSDGNKGTSKNRAFATIDYAVGKCTADKGDFIIVMPNHAETLTTAITCDIAGVTICGLGSGTNRPQLTVNAAIDGITLTAANVTIDNLEFPVGTTSGNNSRINVAAAFATVRNCHFFCGAQDADTITITGAGDDCVIENCTFTVSADGPEKAVHIEDHGCTRLTVRGCFFNGGSAANSWDNGVIFSSGPHTECVIDDNNFLYMSGGVGGVEFTAAATGLIRDNFFGGGTLGGMLDPGSCYCMLNKEADAVDENARTFPTSDAS